MSAPSVVLDTNVLVAAAFRPGSASRRVVDAARRGELRPLWSDATRRETEGVLRRIPRVSWREAEDLFRDEHRRAAPDPAAFPEVPDLEDRKFAALAAAAGAVLVTMDAALLEASGSGRFVAVTPSALLATLEEP